MELPSISIVFKDFLRYPSRELAGPLWASSCQPVRFAYSVTQGNSCSCPKINPNGCSLPRREGVENAGRPMCDRLAIALHFQSRPKWSVNDERMRAKGAGFLSQISNDSAAWCTSISNGLIRPLLIGRGSENSSYARSKTQSISLKF